MAQDTPANVVPSGSDVQVHQVNVPCLVGVFRLWRPPQGFRRRAVLSAQQVVLRQNAVDLVRSQIGYIFIHHLPGRAFVPHLGMDQGNAASRAHLFRRGRNSPTAGNDKHIRQTVLGSPPLASGSTSLAVGPKRPGCLPRAAPSFPGPVGPFPGSTLSPRRGSGGEGLWPVPLFKLQVLGAQFGHDRPQPLDLGP